jgi:lipoprotein-releasing system permease protein
MHLRRLALLLALALAAALPEALIRSNDAQVAFQTSMVVQLLGVIVAAIALAALSSVLGLGIVRLATRPWRHRASTFVAWSFLRAPRVVQPVPVRLWLSLRRAVDAPAHGELPPRTWWQMGLTLLCLGGAAGLLALAAGRPPTDAVWLRNPALALGLHGFLLVNALLPGRRARLALPVLLLAIGALAAAVLGRLPVVLPWFDTLAAVAALAVLVVVAMLRAGVELGRAARWVRTGQALLPFALVLGVVGGLFRGQPWAVAATSAAVVWAAGAVYLLLQGQAKVSLPVFVSIVGVAAGTWALIVVLSVMGGFAADLRAKMLVANAHVLVERPGRAQPFVHAAGLASALRSVPGVAAVSPQARGDAILSSAFNVHNFVAVRGIDPDLPEVQRELGLTVRTGGLHLLAEPGALGSDRALGPKPSWEAADVPPPPELPAAATPAVRHDRDLDALLQLAPGPAEPHTPIVLPIGASALEPAPLEAPPIELQPTVVPGLPPPARDDDTALPGVVSDVPLHPGILLGSELARTLQVELGDRVEVVTPDADIGPTGLRPRVRTFRVAGTFETGLYEADSKVAYVALTDAARYFNLAGDANVFELRLDHPEEPDAVVASLRAKLREAGAPVDVEVLDWRALNRSLFSALAFERLVIFLVLGLIILVAAFSIVSALTMVILQKHDAIAMLRAMGSTASAVRSSFLQMGAVIGLIGTTAGALLGLGTCALIQTVGIQLPEAYYVRTLPVRVQPLEIAAVVVAAVALSLVATFFPATSAARLKPLEGLRHG